MSKEVPEIPGTVVYEYHAPMVLTHLRAHKLDPCPHCGGQVRPMNRVVALMFPRAEVFNPRQQTHPAIALWCRDCKQITFITPPADVLAYASLASPDDPNWPPEFEIQRLPGTEPPEPPGR